MCHSVSACCEQEACNSHFLVYFLVLKMGHAGQVRVYGPPTSVSSRWVILADLSDDLHTALRAEQWQVCTLPPSDTILLSSTD